MGPADRPPRQDRQPGRQRQPLQGRAQGRPERHPERRLTTEERRFRFAQWEFPGRLGPAPGRYVVRRFAGDDVRWVVVATELPPPKRRGRPDPDVVTRVTVIDPDSLVDDATADDWLRHADVSADALAVLRQFVASHRVAAADPFVADADPGRALRIRVGYGSGEQVAEAEWMDVRELAVTEPDRRRARRSKHRPADRLAALLSARDATLASEELTLRARGDLDCGRHREAALQLEAALLAALSELEGWRMLGDLEKRLPELAAQRDSVAAAAVAARRGTLDAGAVEVVSAGLSSLEAALRARALYAAQSL